MEKVEIRKALTRRSLAIGLVFTFAIFFYIWYGQYAVARLRVQTSAEGLRGPQYPQIQPIVYIVRNASDRDIRVRGMLEPWFAVMLLPTVICAALPKKWRLSPPELAFVTTMCAVSLTLQTDFTFLETYHRAIFIPEVGARRIKCYAPYIPKIWGPMPEVGFNPDGTPLIDTNAPMVDVLRAMRYGTVRPARWPVALPLAVPWWPWLIPLLAWIGLTASLMYFFLFGAALLRRQYLDIEALPFPQASAAGSFINLSDSETGRGNLFRRTSLYLWIGVLATLLVEINAILTCIKPAWALANPIPVELDLTPNALIAGIPYFNWWPLLLGLALIFTRAVNFSAFLMCTLWLWILPTVFIRTGVWPVTLTPGGAVFSNAGRRMQWLIRRGFTHPEWGGAMQGWDVLHLFFGIILGLAVWPILVHRRVWISSIRAAVRGEAAGPEEVSSHRSLWLGWGASAGVSVAMLMLFGLHIQWAMLWLLYMGTMFLGYTRIQAECGWIPNIGFQSLNHRVVPQHIIMNHTPIGYDPYQAEAFGPLCFVYGMRQQEHDWEGFNGLSWRLENFRIGSLTNSRPRDIFVSQAIAIPIGTAFMIPFYLWWHYTVGIQKQNAAPLWNLGASVVLEHTLRGKIPGMTQQSYGYAGGALAPVPTLATYSMWLVGFALVAVIFTLRARFGGLLTLISPAGLALAGLNFAFWFPCLIAFIAQTIVIRVGGTRLYEEKVRPIGVGMLIGYGILWIIVFTTYFIRGIPYVMWPQITWPQIRWPWSA